MRVLQVGNHDVSPTTIGVTSLFPQGLKNTYHIWTLTTFLLVKKKKKSLGEIFLFTITSERNLPTLYGKIVFVMDQMSTAHIDKFYTE